MKKVDLLQALSGKFYKVETPTIRQTYGNLKYYLVKVYDLVGEALRDMNIGFYVENEGEAGEVAYWSPSEPKPEAVTGFQQELNVYIAGKITDGTIEGAFIESLDNVNETAIAKVVKDVSGELKQVSLFVDRDTSGNLQHRQIV